MDDTSAPTSKPRSAAQENQKRMDEIVRDYLDNWLYQTHDLTVENITSHDFFHFERALKSGLADKLYYEYDAEGRILTLKNYNASPFNDPVLSIMSRYFSRINADESRDKGTNYWRSSYVLPPREKSGNYSMKVADGAVQEGWRPRGFFPMMVVEVAFTQSYESVLEDARQWLVRSVGAVRLVILVKFEEGALVKPSPRLTSKKPARPPGVPASKNLDWEEIVPAEWVGPIVGYLEIWRYDIENDSIYIDCPRMEIFPTPNTDSVPQLKATDIFRGALPTDTRTFPLDFERFPSLMEDEIRRLAYRRMDNLRLKVKGIKTYFHDFNTENYQPSDSESKARKKKAKVDKEETVSKEQEQAQEDVLA